MEFSVSSKPTRTMADVGSSLHFWNTDSYSAHYTVHCVYIVLYGIPSGLNIAITIWVYLYSVTVWLVVVVHSLLRVIIIAKLLLRLYPREESSSMAHLVQGLGKIIVRVQCKVHQQ